ncbi:UDP-N-acetylmuramoyl-tripeptide--D-alanyl-D-alanine ligase [Caldinitratiruptor microaerophilus]|uniref:UDP-N-acetylmuramoyl-tripeptide--D-alanyl-D-alanine ligase n=1 Tax=Caldinitratiruptor microaerophilus TaxID=671077 RepID=A0AA35CNU2_9FIRM|nr:UDP-N-acetylmuramoyl-tripeptide--D-alanyl-D-alanine ligase [Caldinitratiruptor microaerophilus]
MLRGDPGAPVAGFRHDSRQVQPGDCFVALPGARTDGHLHVPAAAAAGAACALVARDVPGVPPGMALIRVPDPLLALGSAAARHRQQFPVRVAAVTGSVGKTTTKDLVWAVLSRRYRTLRNPGNLNSEVGLPLAILNGLGPEHGAAVLEMAMRGPGQIAYLASIARPEVGVVTCVAPVHLELLGTIENIARAKAELVQALPADGVAILNGDDPRVAAMAAAHPRRVVYYGKVARGTEFVALEGAEPAPPPPGGLGAQRLRVRSHAGQAQVYLPVPGEHVALDALAALAAGLVMGLSLEEAAEGLSTVDPGEFRMRLVETGGVRILDDTYNASPASVKAALAVLARSGQGRRTAILGDMFELGALAAAAHREVGQAAAAAADVLVAVGELARGYAEGAREAGLAEVHHFVDRQAALAALAGLVQPGDTVLVKGSRGMRMEEFVERLRLLFGGPGPGGSAA